jgi:hypothetical protein
VLTSLRPSGAKTSDLLGPLTDAMPPAYVYTGPKRADAPQFAVAAAPKRVAPKPPATASADAGTPRHRSLAAGASSRASFVPPTAASAAPSPNLRIAAEEPGEPRAPKKPKRTLAKPKPQTATIPVAAAPKPATAPKPTGAPKPAAAKPAAVARPAVAPKPAAASATAPKPAAAKPIAAPKPSGAPKPAASTPSAPRAAAPPKPQAAGRPANAPRTASAPNLTQQ